MKLRELVLQPMPSKIKGAGCTKPDNLRLFAGVVINKPPSCDRAFGLNTILFGFSENRLAMPFAQINSTQSFR